MLSILGALLFLVEYSAQLSTDKSCTCAAMDTQDYSPKETMPLMERSLDILSDCSPNSAKLCKDLCLTLAMTTKEDPEGGNRFCEDVKKNVKDVHVSVYSKVCDNDFEYTGITFDKPTCCQEGKRVSCEKCLNEP